MFGRKIPIVSVLLAIMPMLFSCQVQKGWVYKPNTYRHTEKNMEKVYVHTFQDCRDRKNQEASLLYLIPFVPFGWQNLSMPEHIQQYVLPTHWEDFNPKIDFAQALVEEIKKGSHFKEVLYTNDIVESAYQIQGKIINTDYRSKIYSYCMSFGGGFLWFLGFPVGSFNNNLEIELTCYDANGDVFLQKTYHPKQYKKTVWIYKPKGDFEFASLLKSAYADFIRDFNNYLSNKY